MEGSSENRLRFTIDTDFSVLPPGMYFIVTKITDISKQFYVDSHTIVRVRLQSETMEGRRSEEHEIIAKYRRMFESDDVDQSQYGASQLDQLLGKNDPTFLLYNFEDTNWQTSIEHEWVSYKIQHMKSVVLNP